MHSFKVLTEHLNVNVFTVISDQFLHFLDKCQWFVLIFIFFNYHLFQNEAFYNNITNLDSKYLYSFIKVIHTIFDL